MIKNTSLSLYFKSSFMSAASSSSSALITPTPARPAPLARDAAMPPVMLSHKQRAPTPAREGAGTVIDGLGATTDTPPAKDLLPSGVVLAGQDALTVCCCLIATIMVAGLPPGDSAPGERAPLSPVRRSATALSPKAPLKAWTAKPQDRHDPGRTLFELFLTSVSCPVRGLASALIVGC